MGLRHLQEYRHRKRRVPTDIPAGHQVLKENYQFVPAELPMTWAMLGVPQTYRLRSYIAGRNICKRD